MEYCHNYGCALPVTMRFFLILRGAFMKKLQQNLIVDMKPQLLPRMDLFSSLMKYYSGSTQV